ncbi:SDR family oxidoreductase [Actinotalea sp. JY-7885]|uniref:SDR family oxidoreductase n=1 Tax=Actinotalea sp. JY-7885 TaxID=2758576 RepID=UPI00165EA942|nr:SDR family oxidoreductase [Actinotalea sp. JY-7885]
MSIVVTGATGHLGRHVVEELLERGVAPADVVAGGRALERVADLAERGVRTARVDYDDPASVAAVLGEGDTVLLISASEPGRRVQQRGTVIDAAARAGVARLVYTSVLAADTTALVLAPEHKATEELLAASGLTTTVLRNGWYSENYVPTLEQARATGVVLSSTGGGRVASAARDDYAAAAAVVLTTDGHEGAVHELSGDTAWAFDELAAVLSELLGREVQHDDVTPEEHRAALLAAGLDEATAGFVVALDGNIRDGALAATSGTLSRLIGRPTTPLADTLRRALP